MRINRIIACIMAIVLLLSGCGRTPSDTAGLMAISGEADTRWGIPGNIKTEGQGNHYRIVAGTGLGAPEALELAAGGHGAAIYFQEVEAGEQASASYRLQFLSTQGTGRISISALDDQGNITGLIGWVFTGKMPQAKASEKWLDVRYQANYVGDWVSFRINIHELIAKYLSAETAAKARRYRFAVETGQGQHALVTQVILFQDVSKILRFTPHSAAVTANVGDTITVSGVVENTGMHTIKSARVEVIEPFGFGVISVDDRGKEISELRPGEKRTLAWTLKAQRPDAVNLNKPWQVKFKADGRELAAGVTVAVADNRPGRIYYVMTEDLEPIDSAGYPVAWGNGNGWLEPEELVVQMAGKAEKLNSIAEKYGAKWTHYTAFPVIRAAEWAATRSSTGKWGEAAAAVKKSIQQQANRGHEYSLHLHIDYDPKLPGNVLSYNQEVDGLWANHLRHGWAHSIAVEGNFNDPFSRTGSLYSYQSFADELSAASPLGQLVTARVGSFDFGHGSESEAISTRAYRKVGIWGSSDADGNAGGSTSAAFGREIYFTRPDDINQPAEDLKQIGLVEFRPTPQSFIMYDSQKTGELNQRVDDGVSYFTAGVKVKSGVHGIIGFTHAMFIMGEGDWRSTEGGQFHAIDAHLEYIKTRYVDSGIIQFGTANDLVKAYLDYYTPVPVAVYGSRKSHTFFSSEYEVRILGTDIPIGPDRSVQVGVKYPLYLRDSAYRITVLKNGTPIYSTFGLPTPYNDIVFTVDDKNAEYSLKVYHNHALLKIAQFWSLLKSKIF